MADHSPTVVVDDDRAAADVAPASFHVVSGFSSSNLVVVVSTCLAA